MLLDGRKASRLMLLSSFMLCKVGRSTARSDDLEEGKFRARIKSPGTRMVRIGHTGRTLEGISGSMAIFYHTIRYNCFKSNRVERRSLFASADHNVRTFVLFHHGYFSCFTTT